MDYSVTSGFYMGHYDPPWGKPPWHLLSAYVQENDKRGMHNLQQFISVMQINTHDGVADHGFFLAYYKASCGRKRISVFETHSIQML